MKDKELERVLKALANRRRIAIIRYVQKEGEAAVGDIANHLNLSFKATSRHLSVLSSADILDRNQRSVYVFYFLSPTLPILARRIVSFL